MSPHAGGHGTQHNQLFALMGNMFPHGFIFGGECWAAHTQSQGCWAHHQVPVLHLSHVGPWRLQGQQLLLHVWLWPWHGMAVFHLWAPRMGTKLVGPGKAWLKPSFPQRSHIPALGSPSILWMCIEGGFASLPPLLRYFGAVCPALVSATVEGEEAMSNRTEGVLWVLPSLGRQ